MPKSTIACILVSEENTLTSPVNK